MHGEHKCTITTSYGGFVKSPDLISTRCQLLLKYWFTISLANPRTKYYFRSIKSYEDERKRHLNSKYWYIIHPYSKFSYYWGIIMMVTFMVVPPCDYVQNVYILSDTETPVILDALVTMFDSLNTIHIVVSFFTGYEKDEELISPVDLFKSGMYEIELDPGKIAKKYVFSYLFIDMIGVLSIVKYYSSGTNKKFHKYFAFYSEVLIVYLQIFRISRVVTAVSTLQFILWNHKVKDVVFKISKCLIWSFEVVMFWACHSIYLPNVIYNLKGVSENTFQIQVEKLYENAKVNKPNIEIIIMHSVKEVIEGVITPYISFIKISIEDKMIFSMLFIFSVMGKFLIFIEIYRTISDMFSPCFTYEKVKNELQGYLIFHNIDAQLCHDAEVYLHQIMRNKYFNEQNILNMFPYNLQYEIFLDSSMNLIKTCELFTELPEQTLKDLSLLLHCEYQMPGENIIRIGERATCMYFIASGTVAIYSQDTEICHLSDGQYFGETGLLNEDNLRTADVIAIEYCKIYRLRKEEFDDIVRKCEYIYEKILKHITRRTTRWGSSIAV